MTHPASPDLCREAARHQMVEKVCTQWAGIDRKTLAAIITRGLILIGVADFASRPIAAVVAEVIVQLAEAFDLPPFDI